MYARRLHQGTAGASGALLRKYVRERSAIRRCARGELFQRRRNVSVIWLPCPGKWGPVVDAAARERLAAVQRLSF